MKIGPTLEKALDEALKEERKTILLEKKMEKVIALVFLSLGFVGGIVTTGIGIFIYKVLF